MTTPDLFIHFYKTLAHHDNEKYNELLRFSKNIIQGTCPTKLIHICGSGNNGKTTLINILRQYTACIDFPLTKFKQLENNNITDIKSGYCIIEEPVDDDILNYTSIFKELTGGDFNVPQISFIFITNTKLVGDEAFNKRLYVIEMNANIKNKDLNIVSSLMQYKDELKDFILTHG
jgi:hypothetical protein